MPIDYKKYPADWGERRKRILKRADNKCESCGVDNYSIGYRDTFGIFHVLENTLQNEIFVEELGLRVIKIILTIAHLDHDPENINVSDERLRAWCQRCHLVYDIPEKKRRKFDKKAISRFF